MYPADQLYSYKAFVAWQLNPRADLRSSRQSASEILCGPFWKVSSWDEVRAGVSFLTLMNKRSVLYFRGQDADYEKCLPTLFRSNWSLAGRTYPLHDGNRGRYYATIKDLQDHVFEVISCVGTPRYFMLEHYPPAAAAILQHYELWPTHMIDVTRSLPIALSFASRARAEKAYLYVFSLPDLRGSITSDLDQHLSISRLEAICPPAAKRPHHQDAYLIGMVPEPPGDSRPGEKRWDVWQDGSDLMNRLVAKFLVYLKRGSLPGAPAVSKNHLLPQPRQDILGQKLYDHVQPIALKIADQLTHNQLLQLTSGQRQRKQKGQIS